MRKNSLKAAGAATLAAATVVTGLGFGPVALAASAAEPATKTTPTASSSWVPSDGTRFKLVQKAPDGRWWGQLVPGEMAMKSYSTKAEAEAHSVTLTTSTFRGWFTARFTEGDMKGQCLAVIKSFAHNVDILDYRGRPCGNDWTQFRMDSSGRMVSVDRDAYIAATPAHLPDASWMKLAVSGPAAHFANLNPALDPLPGQADIADRTAELSGVAKPGSTVVLRYASTAAKNQRSDAEQRLEVGASGTWKSTLTGLSYGDNTVRVENWVGATQISEATATVTLPIAPVTAEAKVYTGDSSEKVVVRGSGEPGTEVTIFNEKGEAVGGSKVGDYDGRYFASVNAPNTPGKQTFTVKQYVFDEEAGSATATFDYGAGVSVTSPSTGSTAPGGPVGFSGKGEPRGEVSLTEQGSHTALGKGTVDARGEWKIEGVDLDGQKHDLVVTQVAKGNNTTTARVVLNPDGSDTPPAPTGGVTLPNNVTEQALVNGRGVAPATGEPDTIITVKEGTKVIGTGTVKSSGNWLVRINPLGPGVHTLHVTQTVKGHVSPPLVTTVDYGPALAVTGPVRSQAVAGRTTFTGTGAAGSEIVVRAANRVPVCKVVMTTTGPWSCSDTNNLLPMGKYNVLVEQVAKGRLLTTATASLEHLPANYQKPTVTSPGTANTVHPTIAGKATPNATIRVKNAQGTTIVDTRADGAGNWSKVPAADLTAGSNALTVTQIVNPGGHADTIDLGITVSR